MRGEYDLSVVSHLFVHTPVRASSNVLEEHEHLCEVQQEDCMAVEQPEQI